MKPIGRRRVEQPRANHGILARGTWAPGAYPHQLSWMLDTPLRRLVLTPETLADRLGLVETSRVLEVGPGPGYFSVTVAERVPRGELALFDLQPEMLAKARRKLEARRVAARLRYDTGDAGAGLPYPDHHFDVAFLVAVLGEVPDAAACLGSLHRVLRPTGTLAIHEAFPDPDMIRCATLVPLVQAAGFTFQERRGPPWNFTATFRAD